MSKKKESGEDDQETKQLVILHGEIKTPPFSKEARKEAGYLLRLLQFGELLSMPQAELLPIVGKRCGALRIRDEQHNWRIMYRADAAAVLIVDVYDKKTQKIPDEVIARCKQRLREFDHAVADTLKKRKKGKG